MDLGQVECEAGCLLGRIIEKRVNASLQLTHEQPARSLGRDEHDREFKFQFRKGESDGERGRRVGCAGEARACPGNARGVRVACAKASQGRSTVEQNTTIALSQIRRVIPGAVPQCR